MSLNEHRERALDSSKRIYGASGTKFARVVGSSATVKVETDAGDSNYEVVTRSKLHDYRFTPLLFDGQGSMITKLLRGRPPAMLELLVDGSQRRHGRAAMRGLRASELRQEPALDQLRLVVGRANVLDGLEIAGPEGETVLG